MTKIEIVNIMVDEGYALFNESVEDFAARFTLEDLIRFLERYRRYYRGE